MKIAFTGDVVFSGYFANMESQSSVLDEKIVSFLSDTDHCICDIEGPIISGQEITHKVAIRSLPQIYGFLKRINGDILCLGNNHILDYGNKGLCETLEFSKKNHLQTIGAGKNIDDASKELILSNEVGLLSIRYFNKHDRATRLESGCLIWDEDEIIKERIKTIKKNCRWCVLVIHGGNEFCPMPFPDVRKRYLKFLEWGADIIVGHHPHVVQNYEILGEKIIFYSIGNFVFDDEYMRTQQEAKIGILLKIDFQDDGYLWTHLPICIDGDSHKISETEKPAIFRDIQEAEYIQSVPSLIKEFKRKERINLRYCLKRTDIGSKAKIRIIASHLKRYFKIEQRGKV